MFSRFNNSLSHELILNYKKFQNFADFFNHKGMVQGPDAPHGLSMGPGYPVRLFLSNSNRIKKNCKVAKNFGTAKISHIFK